MTRSDWERFAPWRFGWLVALMASVAIGVWAEAKPLRGGVALQLLALAPGAAAWFGQGSAYVSSVWTMIALIAAFLVAPAPNRTEHELWSFDARAVALLIFAFVATSVIVLGVSALEAAARYLFDLDVLSQWSPGVAKLGYFFVLPVYWCALLPRPGDPPLAPDDLLLKAATAFGALLAAVAAALAILLHVYAVRILFEAAMPKNQVGWIVSTTLLTGLAAWFVSGAEGGPAQKWRSLFRRAWFPLTALPTVLLVFAIRDRIGAYGVTSERYAVAAAGAVSICFLALLLFARGRTPAMRGALAAGLLVAALAAIGPQSMPNVVGASQIARLKDKLTAAGVLRDGRIEAQLPDGTWTPPAATEIATIIAEIYQVGGENRLKAMMPADTLKSSNLTRVFLAADYSALKQNAESIQFISRSGAVEIGAGIYLLQFSVNRPGGAEQVGSVQIDGRLVRLEPRRLLIVDGEREIAFDLAPLDPAFNKTGQAPISILSADGKSTLIVNATRIGRTGGATVLEWINGAAVIAKP